MNIEEMVKTLNSLQALFGQQQPQEVEKQYDGEKVIVRTYSAGVFYGELISRKGKEGIMRNARRIWYWAGAASLSELAQCGTKKPDECKFPVAVSQVELTEIIEVLSTTAQAQKSIEGVKVWSA